MQKGAGEYYPAVPPSLDNTATPRIRLIRIRAGKPTDIPFPVTAEDPAKPTSRLSAAFSQQLRGELRHRRPHRAHTFPRFSGPNSQAYFSSSWYFWAVIKLIALIVTPSIKQVNTFLIFVINVFRQFTNLHRYSTIRKAKGRSEAPRYKAHRRIAREGVLGCVRQVGNPRSNAVDGGLSAAGNSQTGQRPVMIYAPAYPDHYIPIRNLSATHTHYTTEADLCSTTRSTCRTCRSLPTTTDPSTVFRETSPAPLAVLARPPYIPFDHTTTVGLPYSLTRHTAICPPTDAKPDRPDINLWPTDTEPGAGSDTDLGSTITNPRCYYGLETRIYTAKKLVFFLLRS